MDRINIANGLAVSAALGCVWHAFVATTHGQIALEHNALWLPAAVTAGLAAGSFTLWTRRSGSLVRELLATLATLYVGVFSYLLVGLTVASLGDAEPGPIFPLVELAWFSCAAVLATGIVTFPLALASRQAVLEAARAR